MPLRYDADRRKVRETDTVRRAWYTWLISADPSTPRRISNWILDTFIAVVVLAAAFFSFPGEPAADGPVTAALAILPALFLPLRRRWPIPVLCACVAVFAAAAFGGSLTPGVLLAAAIAMHSVATREPPRVTRLTAGVAIVFIVLVTVFASIGEAFDPLTLLVAITIAFSTAAGEASRSRRDYLQAVTDRAVRAERERDAVARRMMAEDRLRIARDLHDTVAHQISVISLNAGLADAALAARPERTRAALDTIRTASRSVLVEIGDLLAMLRASSVEPEAHHIPQPGFGRIGELADRFREFGLTVSVDSPGELMELSPAADTVAFRVVQEALTNAHKYGAPQQAVVSVEASATTVTIVVVNPLDRSQDRAAEQQTEAGVGGYGLLGLRERLAAVRGALSIEQTAAEFRLTATIPTTEEAI